MSVDLSANLMQATVEVEQTLADGSRIMGTGFLVNDPTPDGRGRTVLVTANHVFSRMTGATAHIGYREQDKDGDWRYDPQPIAIR
ncbi:MAG TPA: serine protease, partial [Caulobacteraceae bacterium]|nr:serine protease [Caulobacteraceae bacterium]